MKEAAVLESIALKKRFCKDVNLPISVFDNPYFYDRLSVLSKLRQYRDCIEKFSLFLDEMDDSLWHFSNEQDYFEYYNKIKNSVITALKENRKYQEFNEMTFTPCMLEKPVRLYKNLYTEENAGKEFISIDIRKANFSSLYLYSPDIFDGATTWEDYLWHFTAMQHIINSKYIRQVIMGACNPKRQIAYEKSLMTELANKLLKDEYDVCCLNSDEIVIRCLNSDEKLFDAFKEKVKNDYTSYDGLGQFLKIEYFKLVRIAGTDGWMKINPNASVYMADEVEIKGLESELYPQVIKYLCNLEISENDLVFYHNGRLAKFLRPIENPFCGKETA